MDEEDLWGIRTKLKEINIRLGVGEEKRDASERLRFWFPRAAESRGKREDAEAVGADAKNAG